MEDKRKRAKKLLKQANLHGGIEWAALAQEYLKALDVLEKIAKCTGADWDSMPVATSYEAELARQFLQGGDE